MAISSEGGKTAIDTGGVLSSATDTVGATQAGVTAAPLTEEERKAYAEAHPGESLPPSDTPPPAEDGNTPPASTDKDKGAEDEADKDKPKEPAERTDEEIKAALKEAGGFYADPRYEAAALEFEKTGDVSEATIKATAEAFNVPEDMAKEFINLQKAQRENAAKLAQVGAEQTAQEAEAEMADIRSVIGDKGAYEAFQAWGKDNLSDAEKAAYDKALETGPEVAKLVLAGFKNRYLASGAKPARDVSEEASTAGKDGAKEAAQPYASQAESQRDMADPLYKTDPAFRAKVAARLAASKW